MAEAAITTLVQLLGDVLIQKFKFLQAVEGKVQLLQDELKRMKCFLVDANRKQFEDERVRNWISDIREAALDARDTIQLFLINVENPRKTRGLLQTCTCFPKHVYHLDKIGEEIESIQARLDDIDKSRERYGIKDLGNAADSTRISQAEEVRRLPYWKKDEQVVGIEEDVEKVLRESILDEEKKGLSVTVIAGMGGIGKSTLAREIYNNAEVVVVDRFDCRVWVVVSSEFAPQETMKQIMREVPGFDKKKLGELEELTKDKLYLQEKLKEMLHKLLEDLKYFVVLDDVWEKEHWESLKDAFPCEQDKTSRLLLTSRNKDIAMCGQYVHEMKLLDQSKSRKLFMKKAFIDNTDGEFPQQLETIGKQILEKCDGLPLAISVAGGLLVQKQTKNEWKEVLNQINSSSRSSASTILELSYQNLSPQLKSCFLCLAFFKEDSAIKVKRLINIWIGQGLIQQEGSRAVDVIARGYLNELINRSMVQIEDLFMHERVQKCRLHDLLRELCLRKAKEEMGLEIVKGKARRISSYKNRHRVVYGKNLEPFSSNENKHIRSLSLLDVSDDGVYMKTPSRYWKSFQLLEMLDLEGCGFRGLPDFFRLLIGLKYLRIYRDKYRIHRFVLQLPSWFHDLTKLEVLDVENELIVFPDVALKMERLRHFRLYHVFGRPMRIDNWKNIETLNLIRLVDLVECSSGLMDGCNIRELGIHVNGFEKNDEMTKARELLQKMENLVELSLLFNAPCFAHQLIPHLDSLTTLKLSNGMITCPEARVFPQNLSRLTLSDVDLDPMDELGKLPKLQYLKLSRCGRLRFTILVLAKGFPCLEALSLHHMPCLEVILVGEGGLPRLKQLHLRRCPNLVTDNLPKHLVVISA